MKHPNEKYNAFFTDENYAVMRHAHTKESEAVLWPQSAAICEQVVADFA